MEKGTFIIVQEEMRTPRINGVQLDVLWGTVSFKKLENKYKF